MFEKMKADVIFDRLLKRPDIMKAYAMVGPEDSWYDTISTVHRSLAEIRKLPHEQWQITGPDGVKLQGLYYPCGESSKTMVWVHGYTSHAERESAFPALFYRSLGFNVLIPYLRAHGPSEGKYIALGALEYQDISRWVKLVNQHHPDGQILIHGLSMGGGIVLDLATVELRNVCCMVCDAPSVRVEDIFRNVSKSVFKGDGDRVCEQVLRRFRKEFGVDAAEFDRVRNITKGKYPLLLTAGSNEQMEEVLMQIQANCPMDTAVLILPGCNHGNGMYKQTEMYQSAIRALIDRSMNHECDH